jgi:hypothetical protein
VEFKVKLTEWMGATIAIAGLAMSVQTANAQNCRNTWDSGCVAENTWLENTWEINGSNFPPEYWPYSPYANGGSVGGGGTATPTTSAEWKAYFERLIKLGGKGCKKSGETCAAWGQRMISRGFGNSSVCDVSGALGAQYVQAACNLAINEETTFNECANAIACPN